jgi:hypothetical protein
MRQTTMNTHTSRGDERGAALVACVLLVVILSMLGTVSLNLAGHEVEAAKAAVDDMAAEYLAEAGMDLVARWFHDRSSLPNAAVAEAFTKRFELPLEGPSFFDANGASQFTGTRDHPDVSFDAARAEDDRVLNGSLEGPLPSLKTLGRLLKLRVYGPVRLGLLCTVEITATAGGVIRTASLQLGAHNIPALRAGAQLRTRGVLSSQRDGMVVPVWVHWGDLKVKGDVGLGRPREIPAKTEMASVSNQSYGDMLIPEDRWLDILAGGNAIITNVGSTAMGSPNNVFPNRDPSPGLNEDHWDYETLKRHARFFGAYYVPDSHGLLYANGVIEPGKGISPTEVFHSEWVGDHHGLVFIDTLDQRPPAVHNLANLLVEADYSEGLFIVNAHLHWHPKGGGTSVSVLSPPPEGSSSLAKRIPVQLYGINLQGVLYVAGDLSFEGAPRMFGGLLTEGNLLNPFPTFSRLEVWYNYDLRSGLVRGLPIVYTAPGTWRLSY